MAGEVSLGHRGGQTAPNALLRNHPAAAAVHLERQDGIGKAGAIVVEKQDSVDECVPKTILVKRLIGAGNIDLALK